MRTEFKLLKASGQTGTTDKEIALVDTHGNNMGVGQIHNDPATGVHYINNGRDITGYVTKQGLKYIWDVDKWNQDQKTAAYEKAAAKKSKDSSKTPETTVAGGGGALLLIIVIIIIIVRKKRKK